MCAGLCLASSKIAAFPMPLVPIKLLIRPPCQLWKKGDAYRESKKLTSSDENNFARDIRHICIGIVLKTHCAISVFECSDALIRRHRVYNITSFISSYIHLFVYRCLCFCALQPYIHITNPVQQGMKSFNHHYESPQLDINLRRKYTIP